jgi:CheY-like chemotaxis protein
MKKKILVIEDDNIIQSAIFMALGDAGFEVVQAFDGQVGIDLVAKEKPDLVLLDILLPVKDGIEVLITIRQVQKNKDLPVMVFTVLQKEELLVQCEALGIQGYFFKSKYSLNEIIGEIEKVLKG